MMGRSSLITRSKLSEMPGDRHSVDENASKTEPAKLLAVFVGYGREGTVNTVRKMRRRCESSLKF
jgi:hypothetical protein